MSMKNLTMSKVRLCLLLSLFCMSLSICAQSKIKIAHMNLGQLSMGEKGHTIISKAEREDKINRFRQLFDEIGADIFCFCEYAPYFSLNANQKEDYNDKTEKVILTDYPFFARNERSFKNCNGIASKVYRLSNAKEELYSKRKGKRGYLVADIEINGKNVKIVETHFDILKYKDCWDSQLDELISSFENEKYVIICGDFNSGRARDYIKFVEHGYKLANHGIYGNLITFPTKKGGWGLDNILCKGFSILNVQVYKTDLSDHYAIECDLEIQ